MLRTGPRAERHIVAFCAEAEPIGFASELGEAVTDGEPSAEQVLPPTDELIRRFAAYGCDVVGPPPTLAEL